MAWSPIDNTYKEVDKSADLEAGKIIYIKATCNSKLLYVKAAVAWAAERAINKTGHYEIISINYIDDEPNFWFKCRVIGSPALILFLVLSGVTLFGIACFTVVRVYDKKENIAITIFNES